MRICEILIESVVGQSAYHATPRDNLPNVMHTGLKPNSSDEGLWDGKRVFLFATLDDANSALINWLGERFEDDILSLIEVDISGIEAYDWDGELYTTSAISPNRLSVVDEFWG